MRIAVHVIARSFRRIKDRAAGSTALARTFDRSQNRGAIRPGEVRSDLLQAIPGWITAHGQEFLELAPAIGDTALAWEGAGSK